MLTLRPDQTALLHATTELFFPSGQLSYLRCNQSQARPPAVLVVAPTGYGKTCMFSSLAAQLQLGGLRVIILVHRHELIAQVSATLTRLEVDHGCIAPHYPDERDKQVQIASVFTLVRRLDHYEAPHLLIIDEAHHAVSKTTWGRIFSSWPNAARLGVTATPERLSGEGLHECFDELIIGPSVEQLIEQGHLSNYRIFAPPTSAAKGVHRRRGDYDRSELAEAMDRPTITGDAVDHYCRLSKGKRALVFCVSVKHANHVASDFSAAGFPSCSIHGGLRREEREDIVRQFSTGEITVLTSCDLVSEGFDLPAIEVAVLLRPTQSLALYLQQVGRALRPYPGKEYALILDHAGNTMRHGLPDDLHKWSLNGRQQREASSGKEAIGCRTCRVCFAAVRSGISICPYCGYEWPIESREVEMVDGELTEVRKNKLVCRSCGELKKIIHVVPANPNSHVCNDCYERLNRQRREVGQAQEYGDLLRIEKERGYRPGWAWHVQQARQRKKGVVVV